MTDSLLAADPDVEKTWMAGALLGRPGVPDDFKATAVLLLSEWSRSMMGADLRIDGGTTRSQPDSESFLVISDALVGACRQQRAHALVLL